MDNIKRITSFEIDHRTLMPGFYISRIDSDITTYDLRTRKPNGDEYMDNITAVGFLTLQKRYLSSL